MPLHRHRLCLVYTAKMVCADKFPLAYKHPQDSRRLRVFAQGPVPRPASGQALLRTSEPQGRRTPPREWPSWILPPNMHLAHWMCEMTRWIKKNGRTYSGISEFPPSPEVAL